MPQPRTRTDDVLTFIPLVERLARQVGGRLPRFVDRQDLVQEGFLGLLQAESRYDASRGVSRKTFLAGRVRGSMLDWLRSGHWMSRRSARRTRDMARCQESLGHRLGRSPTRREVGGGAGLTVRETDRCRVELARSRVESLDRFPSDDSGRPKGKEASDASVDVVRSVLEEETHRELCAGLGALPEREERLIEWYYFGSVPVKEIARRLGVSSARVSQLHARALGRMRTSLENSPRLPLRSDNSGR